MELGARQREIGVVRGVLVVQALDPALGVVGRQRGHRAQRARERGAEDRRRGGAGQDAERVVPEPGACERRGESFGARHQCRAADLALERVPQRAPHGGAGAERRAVGGHGPGGLAEQRAQRGEIERVEQARLQHRPAARVGQPAQRLGHGGGEEGGVLGAGRVGGAQPLAQRGGDGERDGRLAAHEGQEAVARELQDRACPLGADGRRARLAGEQGHLAEEVAGREPPDAHRAALVLGGDVGGERAVGDDVEAVARVALPEHLAAGRHLERLEVRGQLGEIDAVEPREQTRPGEQILGAGGSGAQSARMRSLTM